MEAQGTSWCDLYIIAIRFLNVQRNYLHALWVSSLLFFMGNDCDDDNVAGKLGASSSRTPPLPSFLFKGMGACQGISSPSEDSSAGGKLSKSIASS
jgi:hypothetical protein